MVPDLEQQLAEVRQRAETAKGDRARAEAKVETLEERLQLAKAKLTELGCSTVADAKVKLVTAQDEITEGLARIVAAEKEMT